MPTHNFEFARQLICLIVVLVLRVIALDFLSVAEAARSGPSTLRRRRRFGQRPLRTADMAGRVQTRGAHNPGPVNMRGCR